MNGTSSSLAVVAALGFSFTGMASFGLAKDRHYSQVTTYRAVPALYRIALRWLGTLLLTASLALCVLSRGPSVGTTWWVATLTAGGLTVTALLSYAPRSTLIAALAYAVVSILTCGVIGMRLLHGV